MWLWLLTPHAIVSKAGTESHSWGIRCIISCIINSWRSITCRCKMCVCVYIYICVCVYVCVTVNEASGIWSFHCQEAKYTFVAICAAIRRAEDHSLGNLEDALGEISGLRHKKRRSIIGNNTGMTMNIFCAFWGRSKASGLMQWMHHIWFQWWASQGHKNRVSATYQYSEYSYPKGNPYIS